MSQIRTILEDHSGMDFCGKTDCPNYQLFLDAETAIKDYIAKERLEAELAQAQKITLGSRDDIYIENVPLDRYIAQRQRLEKE